MDFCVLTIFPDMVGAFFAHGIVRRAIEAGIISAVSIDIRDFSSGKHREVDDRPYGGGNGMVMKPEPLAAAIRYARQRRPAAATVLLTPQGRVFSQKAAETLALSSRDLILVCGRYEGVDERVCRELIDEELSIGDYVLTGGEVAAMIVVDAVTRLIPGALGGEESAEKETFGNGRLEHAQFTRPAVFEGQAVPETLLSGNHAAIEQWRLEDSLKRTFLKRPDLLRYQPLDEREREILKKWCREIETLTAT
jgi:tRNA (guanine37-N1)-methyltransferase